MEALLRIKLEGPEIKQFIKEHSSDAAAYWWKAKKQRKGGNRQPKKYKKHFWVRLKAFIYFYKMINLNCSTGF